MHFNVVLFGGAGVGKSSIVNLLAGQDVTRTSANTHGWTMESRQYTIPLKDRTINVWDTTGLGEPSLTISNRLSDIGRMYVLVRQVEEQGGLHLLLFCIGGSRITQNILYSYRLFFEVLCEKRVPIAVVVTRLESEANMEHWWHRNKDHVTRCGLGFSSHVCVTGLLRHPKAAESRAALETLLLDPRENYWAPPAFPHDWFSGFLERFPVIPRPEISKDNLKELERLLRGRCAMDRSDARQLAEYLVHPRASGVHSFSGNLTRMQPLSSDDLCRPLICRWADWLKTRLGSAFPLYDDDIVVFLVGPSGSGKTTFMDTVIQAPGVSVGPTHRPSSKKVRAIRFKLSEKEREDFGSGRRTNIVFVDTPSFFTKEHAKVEKEMSTWLKDSKCKSTWFGVIYLHRTDMEPLDIQKQLDTFAGALPVNFFNREFPLRLHCVLSCTDETRGAREAEFAHFRERFWNQLSELRPRVVNGWKPKWVTSVHPKPLVRDDPDMAWEVVKELFFVST